MYGRRSQLLWRTSHQPLRSQKPQRQQPSRTHHRVNPPRNRWSRTCRRLRPLRHQWRSLLLCWGSPQPRLTHQRERLHRRRSSRRHPPLTMGSYHLSRDKVLSSDLLTSVTNSQTLKWLFMSYHWIFQNYWKMSIIDSVVKCIIKYIFENKKYYVLLSQMIFEYYYINGNLSDIFSYFWQIS